MIPPSASSLLALSAVVSTAWAATVDPVLEPKDFDVADALLDLGVDVTEIPALAEDSKRSTAGCAAACKSLKFLYGDAAVETKGEVAYEAFTSSFWSANQGDVDPHCIFKPSKGKDVSVVVLLSRLTQCPFAAKSGGHAAMAGASSVEGGITISFMNMQGVSLSKDKKVASVEPGNTWGPVFEKLAKSDVTVVGGRLSNIGVGGLTTGGGISYFSNLHGWACDNVDSYEVVLANGAIVKASAKQHKDLYWALRGGGNNFGLVVKFNLKTVPLPGGQMWGGNRAFTEDKFPELTKAVVGLVNNSPKDPKAGFWAVWGELNGTKLALPTLYYSEPDGGDAQIWDEIDAIAPVSDTTGNKEIGAWAKENMEGAPIGLREMYYVISTKVDSGIVDFFKDLFFEKLPEVENIPGIFPNIVVQGITTPQLKKMQTNGGNALGLDVKDGPLLIVQLCTMWLNKSDDEAIYKWMSDIMKKTKDESKARGLDNDYLYMNYASQFQDVVTNYGADNKAKLKSISKKYDPQQVFQVLQPGYFKLEGAPVPNSGYFSH
ncbi:hypothetical protein BHE90_008754 [Fusarium euwallaceae]|uniref:FAD-binding PCMH-type domain-containing protein n=1 Tax=Fusarium euwallaceae TaxID=1147111 RepID=A0A430LM36_9HYPO|nr:hypothetical protein BHE90_008754 [Fusarium euwallaceae]